MSTQSPRLGFVCPCLAAAGLGGVLHLPFLRRAEKYIAYLWQAPCEVFIAAVSPQALSGIWNGVWGKKKKVSRYDSAWSFGNNLWPAFLLRSGVFTCAQEQFPVDF